MTAHARTTNLRIVDPEDETVLSLAPMQGLWMVEQYLTLTEHSRRLVEFDDGTIDVLPIPTPEHQKLLARLYELFVAWIRPLGGLVLFAPLRVQIRPRKFREPDLVVLCDANDPRQQQRYWLGVDLALEIVSDDDPERDTRIKRMEYADAGIPEYWIVNPGDQTITVLALEGTAYTEVGVFQRRDVAVSRLFAGLRVDVDEVFDVA